MILTLASIVAFETALIIIYLLNKYVLNKEKKYFLGQVIFKRTTTEGTCKTQYIIDVASCGTHVWKIYTLKVDRYLYEEYSINDKINVLI